jgi:hypothetical protein
MNVYNVLKNGVYQRQIVADNQQQAVEWVKAYMPSCTVQLAYRFT